MNKSINVIYAPSLAQNLTAPKFEPRGNLNNPDVILAKTVYYTDWSTNTVLYAIQNRLNMSELYGNKLVDWANTFEELAAWVRERILEIWGDTYFGGYQCSEFLRVWFINSIRLKWVELQRAYGDVVPDLYDASEVIPVKGC